MTEKIFMLKFNLILTYKFGDYNIFTLKQICCYLRKVIKKCRMINKVIVK